MHQESAAPYYFRVAETLRGRIARREYRPGQAIPAAWELEREFGVSNITIRKALDLLADEGLISRRRGAAPHVTTESDRLVTIEISGNFRDWLDSASGKRPRLVAELLEWGGTPCPEAVADVLGLAAGGQAWRLRRLRRSQAEQGGPGEPISYYLNYTSPELGRRLNVEEITRRSFVEVFQECTGIRFSRMEQRVRAQVADLDVASLLDIRFGAPVFFVEIVYFCSSGPDEPERPVEVTQTYYRGDRYVYMANITL